MEVTYFDHNVHNVWHIVYYFHLLLVPLNIYYIVELILVSPYLACSLKGLNLCVVIGFHYVYLVKSQFDS